MKFITAHPRFTYLLAGLAMGVVMSAFTIHETDKYTSRMEKTIERNIEIHQEYVERTSRTIEKYKTENRKLKKSSNTYKIVHPDGTVETRTSSKSESEESISTEVKERYEKQIEERMSRFEKTLLREIANITKEQKYLSIGVGYTTELEYYGSLNYTVLPPFTINGWATQGGTVAVGIGVRL